MICRTCKKEFDVITRTDCLVCISKITHKEEYESVLANGKWNEEELDAVLYALKYKRVDSINEILPDLHNKTLDDLFVLLSKELVFGGFTKKRVLVKCEYCGKDASKSFYDYENYRTNGVKAYCSTTCMGKGKLGKNMGLNSPKYSKVEYECDFCKRKILISNYEYVSKRKDGSPSHHYCSKKCSNKHRSEIYSKENHPSYGVKFDNDRIESMRLIGAESIKKISKTMTKPHVIVNESLKKMDIPFTNEYIVGYYSLDIYLDDYALGIEIMGDYWHSNPNIKYNKNTNKIQKDNILRDKKKHTYVKKYNNFEILYLWETDIKTNIELCELLIKEYINKNGILQDYNSFNYYVNGDEILLKSEIVKPYFIN